MVQGNATLTSSTAFNPFKIQQLAKDKQKAKDDAIVYKQHKKDEAREAREAKRLARTCSACNCNTMTKPNGPPKTWYQCGVCKIIFCKKHREEYFQHYKTCSEAANGTSDTNT